LAGLSYAHSRRSPTGEPLGIIHRDLSPSNILCSGEGEVKLSDFGIAKAVTYSSVFYRVRGKVGYMSPEMARNQPMDARSDLFSMGVSLYETLIGERVYSGDLNTPPDKIYAQAIPLLAVKCPSLPRELQGVLDRALAVDPEQRYPDADEFSDALRQVARTHDLLYSAPQLAAELREIMGPSAENWLADERDPAHVQKQPPSNPASTLTGKDVDSLVESGASSNEAAAGNIATPPLRPSASASNAAASPSAPAAPPMPTLHSPAPLPAAPNPVRGTEPVVLASPTESGDDGTATPALGESMQPASKTKGIPVGVLQKPAGGVAAIKRSRRGFWVAFAVLLAFLLAFAFVRFFSASSMRLGVQRNVNCEGCTASADTFYLERATQDGHSLFHAE
jgi:serine/threonine protein kinase